MYIPLFNKGRTNTAIWLIFNWVFTYKNTQQPINITVEIIKNI